MRIPLQSRRSSMDKQPERHFFYVLYCRDHSFYGGYTTDIVRREWEHNHGIGSKYTRTRRPVQCIYAEQFAMRSLAMRAEAHFKQLTRSAKIQFLTSHGLHFPLSSQLSARVILETGQVVVHKTEQKG